MTCQKRCRNSSSSAVAIYCLWRTIQEGETKFGEDTRHFVNRHFYVDDRLILLPTEFVAIDLLKHTCASLAESNLKLHKITLNSVSVMQAFKPEDLASSIKDLSLGENALPAQRSLGMCWDIMTNPTLAAEFWGKHGKYPSKIWAASECHAAMYQPPFPSPLTPKCVSFVTPQVVLENSQRRGTMQSQICAWKGKTYSTTRTHNTFNFVELILDKLYHKLNAVKFYCDSRVVLGYICNDSKRFYVYVHHIRQSTPPEQWLYVTSSISQSYRLQLKPHSRSRSLYGRRPWVGFGKGRLG